MNLLWCDPNWRRTEESPEISTWLRRSRFRISFECLSDGCLFAFEFVENNPPSTRMNVRAEIDGTVLGEKSACACPGCSWRRLKRSADGFWLRSSSFFFSVRFTFSLNRPTAENRRRRRSRALKSPSLGRFAAALPVSKCLRCCLHAEPHAFDSLIPLGASLGRHKKELSWSKSSIFRKECKDELKNVRPRSRFVAYGSRRSRKKLLKDDTLLKSWFCYSLKSVF